MEQKAVIQLPLRDAQGRKDSFSILGSLLLRERMLPNGMKKKPQGLSVA